MISRVLSTWQEEIIIFLDILRRNSFDDNNNNNNMVNISWCNRYGFYRKYSIEQSDIIMQDFVFVLIQYALKLPSVVIYKSFITRSILSVLFSSSNSGSGSSCFTSINNNQLGKNKKC